MTERRRRDTRRPLLRGRRRWRAPATSSHPRSARTPRHSPVDAAWIQRFTAGGALDATFNPTGIGSILPVPGRVVVPNDNLHAIKIAADGSALVAGESMDAAAAHRQMLVAAMTRPGSNAAGVRGRRPSRHRQPGRRRQQHGPGPGRPADGTSSWAARPTSRVSAAFGLTRFTAAGAVTHVRHGGSDGDADSARRP